MLGAEVLLRYDVPDGANDIQSLALLAYFSSPENSSRYREVFFRDPYLLGQVNETGLGGFLNQLVDIESRKSWIEGTGRTPSTQFDLQILQRGSDYKLVEVPIGTRPTTDRTLRSEGWGEVGLVHIDVERRQEGNPSRRIFRFIYQDRTSGSLPPEVTELLDYIARVAAAGKSRFPSGL